jgi:hypothetical protein
MKKIVIAACGIAFAFAGCKEHDTPLIFSTALSVDSTYVLATIPGADAHNALIEDFSGQSCSNCPGAHGILESLEGNGNQHVIGIVYYVYGPPQTVPILGATYDFRDSVANYLSQPIYGSIDELPSGGVDRTPVSGSILLTDGQWSGAAQAQEMITDSINLSVASSYNAGTNVATIKATVTYLYNISTQQNLSIAIVEDSMVDWQTDGIAVDSTYLFTDVFRDMVTGGSSYIGDPVLVDTATKVAGRVYWRQYSYKLRSTSPAINPAHCRVIAYLNTTGIGGDYHVIQSTQCPFE